MIENSLKESKSLNFDLKNRVKIQNIDPVITSKTLPININEDEIKKLTQNGSNRTNEAIYDI